jgi:hypothetical protein
MARKPNYRFERMERDRLKAGKVKAKADAKREERERAREAQGGAAESEPQDGSDT